MRSLRLTLVAPCIALLIAPLAQAVQEDRPIVAGRTLEGWARDLDSENEIVRLRAVKSLGPFGEQAHHRSAWRAR